MLTGVSDSDSGSFAVFITEPSSNAHRSPLTYAQHTQAPLALSETPSNLFDTETFLAGKHSFAYNLSNMTAAALTLGSVWLLWLLCKYLRLVHIMAVLIMAVLLESFAHVADKTDNAEMQQGHSMEVEEGEASLQQLLAPDLIPKPGKSSVLMTCHRVANLQAVTLKAAPVHQDHWWFPLLASFSIVCTPTS